MNKTIATMTTILLLGSLTFASAEEIPVWVKNNAGWWADGTISESEFVQGIQFLIRDGVIVIPPTTISDENSQSVPVWVKNNAGWWADGTITNTEFVQAIQHLIKTGVISVPSSQSKPSDSISKATTNDGSQLASLQSDLDKCNEIFQAYERYHCVDKAKMKLTEYDYEQKSTQYVVGSATFYFPGAELEISPLGQALLTIKMLVKNTGSNENISLFCTGPAVCNYDVWDGQNVFRYSTNDFTNGNIVLTPGTSREFSILFGPQIPIPGSTKFVYDPTKDYFFRISEPWGSASIPLELQ